MNLALVDLGYGNIGSVAVALERLGVSPERTADPARIRAADRVVLPGVGAAGHAMARLRELGLVELLRGLERPLLGICLGMQLLFDRLDEGETTGLGLIPAAVRRLEPGPGLQVPHMGWSRLAVTDPHVGLAEGDAVYFAHGYAAEDGPWTIASARHGVTIPAVVRRDNFLGAQFHPERSSRPGSNFLEAFLRS